MLSKNNSYFDPELRINGHYIVTGNTNDRFCDDTLEITDILPAIHHYLRYEQGFDAVFFLDSENMLFCLDEHSFDILTGEALAHRPAAPSSAAAGSGGEISATGPLGGRRRRSSQPPAAPANTSASQSSGTRPLNMGRMTLAAAWQQVSAVMKQAELPCALVIRNANRMQGGEDTLLELSSFYSTNHSIVIYIFRETTLHNVQEWTNFARNILQPRITATDPLDNRVISLRTPNSLEVRNLLNHIRFNSSTQVLVQAGDIQPLSRILAASCSRNKWGLVNLFNRLIRHAMDHPGVQLSLDTWRDFTEERNYRSPMEELESMVGQEKVKEQLRGWVALQKRQLGSRPEPVSSSRFAPLPSNRQRLGQKLNIRFKGSSGTGKTTIARIIGRFYYELGLLPQGQLVECSGADLISGYVGHTAEQMQQRVQEAMGGVLFIDEAYALMSNQHGQEAINQLVNDMSTYEGQFAVILAAYPRDMDELMRTNDGLASRFPNEYILEDYTPEEMQDIFRQRAASDDQGPITFSPGLEDRMDDFFHAWVGGKGRNWGNAREAANLLVEMKKLYSLRATAQNLSDSGICLTEEDIPESLQHCLAPRSRNLAEALARINSMIGLDSIKRFLRELTQRIRVGEGGNTPGNFIFSGPPGTGKTTVAREMGDLLGLLGILRRKTNNVTECRAADLLNGSVQLNEAVEDARGGVFFLDEAHQLAQNPEGHAIIRALVPLVEDPEIRADTCFICAGYTVEMRSFLAADSGLDRRFPLQNRIRFDDYTADELVQILEKMAWEQGQEPTAGYLARSRAALEKFMERRPVNFGNGGFIRDTYLPGSIAARTRRLSLRLTGSEQAVPTPEQVAVLTKQERQELTEYDLPETFARLAGPVGRRPLENQDPWSRVNALLGKEEIISFARARAFGGEDQKFYDEEAPAGLHYAIVGPSGSGRHTALRTLAALWKHLGLLERDNVLYAGKGDLEAGYVGQTRGKTRDIIEQAIGGTLVIEYPSSMLPQSRTDISFGVEALGEISASMRAHYDDLSVVLVDTPEGLESLTKAQPVLRGQLARVFTLDDLTPDQMLTLFREKTADSMIFDADLEDLLPDFFLNWVSDRGGLGDASRSWSNGGEVDRLIDDLKLNWRNADGKTETESVEEDGQSYQITRRRITKEMIPIHLQRYLKQTSVASEQALQKLDSLPGLAGVKRSLRGIERRIRRLGQSRSKPGCYLYLGNPGVGKTTVARLMGGVLRAAGVLRQGHVIERTARQIGDQIQEFDSILKLAKNGILFIDEAHQLTEPNNYWGGEVIKRLLTVLEDDTVTDSTCIILAGYPQQMLYLLQRDEGLASRFGSEDSIILFEDYTVDELMQVMDYMTARADQITNIGADRPLRMDQAYRDRTRTVFDRVLARGDQTFGNARFVRTYLHDSLNAQLERFDREYGKDDPPTDVLDLLTGADIPAKYRAMVSNERSRVTLTPQEINSSRGQPVSAAGYEQVCENLTRSVVLLEVLKGGQKAGVGTGTIITTGGLVLTCEHLIRDSDQIRARVYCPDAPGGNTRWFEAKVLEPICKDCDMAVLQLDGYNFTAAALRPADEPVQVGEETFMLGYPLGGMLAQGDLDRLRASNFTGRVASCQHARAVERCYIDTTGLHGNSGSPVFSQQDCRIIGLFSGSIIPDRQGSLDELNYFYPIRYFWERFLLPMEENRREREGIQND